MVSGVYAKTMKLFKTSLLCLLLFALPITLSHADRPHWRGGLLAKNNQLSPNEAAARVQGKLGGRILAIETLQRKNKTVYRIKILTGKGVVRVINVNANTGQFR